MLGINTITFDLWQTLLIDTREMGRERANLRLTGTQAILLACGEKCDIEVLNEAYSNCYEECRSIREQGLDISFQEQVGLFLSNISIGLSDRVGKETFSKLMEVYSDAFFVCPPAPHENAIDVLEYLKTTGCKLGLISNTGMTPGVAFRRFLNEHSMLDFFDVLTFSDEVKLSKPSAEMFLTTMTELGSEPSTTLHVGDDVRTDIIGARAVGMKAIWIKGFSGQGDSTELFTEADATVADLSLLPDAIQKFLC
ncbi:MAG: HAD family hydrolase [Chloroflexota bacterium]|nr:HAD family hydrolase [Chloroflexota bacterium]